MRRRLMTVGFATGAALLLLVLLPSCSQLIGGKTVIRQNRKFVVDDSVPLNVVLPLTERPYPYKVAVERFDVSRLYARDQVVYRLSPEEIREDPHLRWAHRPSDMITDAVEGYLRQSFLFANVRQEFLDEPDYTLTGTVKAIERIDSGDEWWAKLAVSMQLTGRSGEIVWSRNFGLTRDEAVQVPLKDFVYTVATMNTMLNGYMAQAIYEINKAMLIPIYREKGQLDQLLSAYENGSATTAVPDSIGASSRMLVPNPDYEIIFGKPTP